jgi:(p)ppGpp synthase/HD superfamily hydrolase
LSSTTETPALTIRYTAAFQLAFEVHAHHLRKSTTIPYLAHVMSVSALVLEAGGDEDCAIAGLLHDAVEDSQDGAAMLDRIRGQFGPRVADIVRACSDTVAVRGQDKEDWRYRKEKYLAHLATADADALLVSACDKLHNSRAIVADMREVGKSVFDRFSTKSGEDQLWYYQSLSDILSERIRHTLANDLREVVVEMTTLGAELGVATEPQRQWITAARALPLAAPR